MNRKALITGYYASIVGISAFVAWTICFVVILLVNPFFIWTNYEDYIVTSLTTNQFYMHIAMVFMIIYAASFVIQVCSIGEVVEESNKFFAKLGGLFSIGFFSIISLNYFVQISAVRLQMNKGLTVGLEQFIQVNPISVIAAMNMLGWTVFFGLSCIFTAIAFGNTKNEKIIKRALLVNGVIVFIGLIGYLLDIATIVFLSMNLGMGAAVLIATIWLSKLFKEYLQKDSPN
jgi:hypothetical protein